MRLKNYLTEKWLYSTKVYVFADRKPIITEIFFNPTKSEYRDAAKASATGTIPAMKGRLATGFISPKGDVWLWRGDVWHTDIPAEARKKIGKGMKGFHFGFSKNEVSLYTTVESGQLSQDLARKLVDRLGKIEPKLNTVTQIYIDDMDIDSI